MALKPLAGARLGARPAVAAVAKSAPATEANENTAPAEAVAKPAPVKAVAKPAAAKPAAAKPAAAKPAAAKPAAAKAKNTAANELEGETARATFQPTLPETIGGRILLDSAQELFFRFAQARMGISKKKTAVEMMDAVFDFLFGNEQSVVGEDGKFAGMTRVVGEPTIESIVENGGLLRFFEAKLGTDVLFKHNVTNNRISPNPRVPGELTLVDGRRVVALKLTVEDGESFSGSKEEIEALKAERDGAAQ